MKNTFALFGLLIGTSLCLFSCQMQEPWIIKKNDGKIPIVTTNEVIDPIVIDASTVQISFTRGIDTKKSQISIVNPATKKEIAVDHLENSTEDLRIVLIKTKQKLETGVLYNLVLKKIFTLAGTELSSENKTTLTISSMGIDLPAPSVLAPEAITAPLDAPEEKPFDEPVPIDTLPQTWSETMFLLFLLAGWVTFLIQKKLHKGA